MQLDFSIEIPIEFNFLCICENTSPKISFKNVDYFNVSPNNFVFIKNIKDELGRTYWYNLHGVPVIPLPFDAPLPPVIPSIEIFHVIGYDEVVNLDKRFIFNFVLEDSIDGEMSFYIDFEIEYCDQDSGFDITATNVLVFTITKSEYNINVNSTMAPGIYGF